MTLELTEREMGFVKNALRNYSMKSLAHGQLVKKEESAAGDNYELSELIFREHRDIKALIARIDVK